MINDRLVTGFINQMCEYVDFSKDVRIAIDERKIKNHYNLTIKHMTPNELKEFKVLVQNRVGQRLMASYGMMSIPEIANANISNFAGAFQSALNNQNYSSYKTQIEQFGKFMCSSTVYMKFILGLALMMTAFSSYWICKGTNGTSGTTA